MNEIDLGGDCEAFTSQDDSVEIWDWFVSIHLSPEQMDALCKWWLEQREQQAKEAPIGTPDDQLTLPQLLARCESLREQRDAARTEAAAVLQHEMAALRNEVRRLMSDNDRLTQAERALEEIGRTIGCGHTGDPDGQMQLVSCVQSVIADLERAAIEAHKAGRSRPIGEIISDLRKEQPEQQRKAGWVEVMADKESGKIISAAGFWQDGQPNAGEVKCDSCGGDGYYKGPRLGDEACPDCKGYGIKPRKEQL